MEGFPVTAGPNRKSSCNTGSFPRFCLSPAVVAACSPVSQLYLAGKSLEKKEDVFFR